MLIHGLAMMGHILPNLVALSGSIFVWLLGVSKIGFVDHMIASSKVRTCTIHNAKQKLVDLHWLPVRARIQYEIVLPTFKTTNHSPHVDPTTVPRCPTYSNSERFHAISAAATAAWFMMLARTIWAVARTVTPRRQSGMLECWSHDDFNNMFYLV